MVRHTRFDFAHSPVAVRIPRQLLKRIGSSQYSAEGFPPDFCWAQWCQRGHPWLEFPSIQHPSAENFVVHDQVLVILLYCIMFDCPVHLTSESLCCQVLYIINVCFFLLFCFFNLTTQQCVSHLFSIVKAEAIKNKISGKLGHLPVFYCYAINRGDHPDHFSHPKQKEKGNAGFTVVRKTIGTSVLGNQ